MDFHGDDDSPKYTESGVYIPLTERDNFIAPVFSTADFCSRLSTRILTPVLNAAAKRQQQQLAADAGGGGGGGAGGGHRRNHSRTASFGQAALDTLLAAPAGAAGGGGDGNANNANSSPTQIAEQLVDLHEEALEMLERLRLEEQRRLVELEKGCAITEQHVRARLSRTRDAHCVSTMATLARMEAVANAALTITASVRSEMAAASSRIARGYHVLGLFEIFDACTALTEDQFTTILDELFVARDEARNAVIAGWKARGSGAGGGAISAAAVHGALYLQPPGSGAGAGGGAGRLQLRTNAGGGGDAGGGDGGGGGGGGGATTVEGAQQNLLRVEQRAIEAGLPEVLARRSRLPEAIDAINKLLPLAQSVVDDGTLPDAENIIEYDEWLRKQLAQEALVLMLKFTELHGQHSAAAGAGAGDAAADGDLNAAHETGSVLSATRVSVLSRVGGGAAAAAAAAVAAAADSSAGLSVGGPGSELVERQAESRRLILLNSVYAKLLLASLEYTTRLHMQSHDNSHDDIIAQLQDFLVADLKRVSDKTFPVSHPPALKGDEFAATAAKAKGGDGGGADDGAASLSAMSPEDRLKRNAQEIASAFDFFIFELLWDLAMIEAMFSGSGSSSSSSSSNPGSPSSPSSSSASSYTAIRAKLCLEVLQRVVRDYAKGHLEQSEARKGKLVQIVEKLSATQARQHAPTIVAELNYHNELLAVLLSQCRRLQRAIGAKFDDLRVPIEAALLPIYDFGATYATSEGELKQLSRALQHQTEEHTHFFALPPDGSPYDLGSGHELVLKAGFDAAGAAIKRAVAICSRKDGARVTVRLGAAFQSYVVSLVQRELQKAVDMLRKESGEWPTWPAKLPPAKSKLLFSREAAELPPESLAASQLGMEAEALFCAMRLYRWGLGATARLSRFMQQTVVPVIAAQPDLLSAYHFERTRLVSRLDVVAGELLTYIAGGITTRSLAVLAHLQDFRDYSPAEMLSTAEYGATGTVAAMHFRRFLAFALSEAEPLLQQLSAAAATAAEERASGWDRQRLDAQLAARRRGDGLRRVLADPKAVASRSFVLHVGCGLYRGLCSHLRSYNVNDIGVLIMKRDVALYREAAQLLFRHAQPEDAVVLDEMFDVIRELMNLLLVPLDNIRNVKVTGLLRELHHRDILEFLQMRRDIGVELAKALKL